MAVVDVDAWLRGLLLGTKEKGRKFEEEERLERRTGMGQGRVPIM